MGQSLHVADLPLPEGTELVSDPELSVVSVVLPKIVEEEVAEPEEGEEGVEGEEGAPPAEGAGDSADSSASAGGASGDEAKGD